MSAGAWAGWRRSRARIGARGARRLRPTRRRALRPSERAGSSKVRPRRHGSAVGERPSDLTDHGGHSGSSQKARTNPRSGAPAGARSSRSSRSYTAANSSLRRASSSAQHGPECSASAPRAIASSEPTPQSGRSSPTLSPSAKAIPARSPVKEPGPTPTPRRSRLDFGQPASASSCSSKGNSRSACEFGCFVLEAGDQALALEQRDRAASTRTFDPENAHAAASSTKCRVRTLC